MSPTSQKAQYSRGSVVVWALKFWWKHNPTGLVLHLITEIYDNLSSIIASVVTSYLLSQLYLYATNGGELITYIRVPLLAYGAQLFVSFVSAQINKVTTSTHGIKILNALEGLFAQKFASLALSDIDGREFANKFELAKEAKRVIASRLLSIINVVKYPVVIIAAATPLIFQGYWFVVLLVSVFVIPISLTNAEVSRKRLNFKTKNVENDRASLEIVSYFQNASDSGKEIKVHNAAGEFIALGTNKVIDYANVRMSFETDWFGKRLLLNIVDTLLQVWVVYTYVVSVGSDVLRLSGILPYLSMVQKVRFTVLNFAQQYTAIIESLEEVQRVKAFLEYEPTELFTTNGIVLEKTAPSLSVNNVSFTYQESNRAVLDGVTFEVKSGQKIALVGENGAGKTTLLKLLMGMYKPVSGSIKINDEDLFSHNAASYYDNLGVLFQAFPQYGAMSVRDNVIAGRYSEKVDKEKIIAALKLADAWDFVSKYPNQLDQVLSHRYKDGISPSTGQWQKIAIARLFYRNPSLVIFDEPTASIDAESEYKIFNEIFSFFKEKTVLIVSHRFSTVRNADKILVISNGKIAEQGTHKELVALGGIYASAYQKQAEGYQEN
jgi:ABC-type multidrug transport system fused ATPase/permease subunit